MIVEDRDNYKLDLALVMSSDKKENYLQLTVFTLLSETEWKSKIMRLSPNGMDKVYEFIKNYKDGLGREKYT